MQAHLDAIREQAEKQGLAEPLLTVTDVFMTCICSVGSKSLSHMLSCIERCKERLLDFGRQSEFARKQIITSVLAYWRDHPGVGVNIIDKLLNYSILTPLSIVEWVLLEHNDGGAVLARAYIYEMVSMTVTKVGHRVRQLVNARRQPGLPSDQRSMLDETLSKERAEQSKLFGVIEDALLGFAAGHKDEMIEAENDDGASLEAGLIRDWGARWLRVFRRKAAVEEAVVMAELAVGVDNHNEGEGAVQEQGQEKNGMEGVDGDGIAANGSTSIEQAASEADAEISNAAVDGGE